MIITSINIFGCVYLFVHVYMHACLCTCITETGSKCIIVTSVSMSNQNKMGMLYLMASTVCMLWLQQTSPLLQRRDRRASSSSRDRSESRDDSHRSTSPHTKIKVKELPYWGSTLEASFSEMDSFVHFTITVYHIS
jgi:hypothetical protein